MNADYLKNHFLYAEIRRALQAGRYAPGERVDPATVADEFDTSQTPVRFALYRLVGEGMLADQPRSGMFVPMPTEVGLRDLYDWMERLLLMACDIGIVLPVRDDGVPDPSATGVDVAKRTWRLFDSIARATDQRALHLEVKRTNDRLAPIRRAKQHLIHGAGAELAALHQHWRQRDIAALRTGLIAYHEQRKELVPRIVAMLSENRDRRTE